MRLNMKINNLNELNTPCLILDKNLLEKNCSKAIDLVLKKFDQSKDERDLELEKIKTETQNKIDSLKDDNQVKVLTSENEKLLSSDFKKLTKKLMRSQIINDGKRVDGLSLIHISEPTRP